MKSCIGEFVNDASEVKTIDSHVFVTLNTAVHLLNEMSMPPPLDDETRYRLLKLLESKPELSQRELASEMGVSLGKINYCLRAVMDRGWVKVKNFTRHPNKRVYAYYLTSKGAEEKAKVTVRFFKRKLAEYEELKQEIEYLQLEAAAAELQSLLINDNRYKA